MLIPETIFLSFLTLIIPIISSSTLQKSQLIPPVGLLRLSPNVPILSQNGLQALSLRTGTRYAILPQGTGFIPCTRLELQQINFHAPEHWWSIENSTSFNTANPTYELVNRGTPKVKGTCDFGSRVNFHPVANKSDTFYISSQKCPTRKTWPKEKNVYRGEIMGGGKIISFCGTLDNSCTYPLSTGQQDDLRNALKSNPSSTEAYEFKFLKFEDHLKERYQVIGVVNNFTFLPITNKTLAEVAVRSKLIEINAGWKVGFLHEVHNCGQLPQHKEVKVSFKEVETSTFTVERNTLKSIQKMDSFSFGGGISVNIPFTKWSIGLGIGGGGDWQWHQKNLTQNQEVTVKEISSSVSHEFRTKVTVSPWSVAKAQVFLNVVRDLKVEWVAEVLVGVRVKDDMDGLEVKTEKGMQLILEMMGYEVKGQNWVWIEDKGMFKVEIRDKARISFGLESFVEVTETPCENASNGMHWFEF